MSKVGFGPSYVSAWIQPELRDEIDDLASERSTSRSEEIRLALLRHVHDARSGYVVRDADVNHH